MPNFYTTSQGDLSTSTFNRSLRKTILYSIFCLSVFLSNTVAGQLFTQQFSTALSASSNTTLTTGTYCSSTPNNTQFTAIGSSGPGCTFEVPASQRLTYQRAGADVASFSRRTNFSTVPTSAIYRFKINVSGNTSAQTNGAKFQIGATFSDGNAAESDGNTHSRLGINWTATDGTFSFRDALNTTSSSDFTGIQTVFWVMNNSGATVTYLAPDGTSQTVNDDKDDVWVGNTLIFNEMPCVTLARTLSSMKFVLDGGSSIVEIDSMLINAVPTVPITTATQNFCATNAPTVANLTATGTNISWYTTANGGSPLPTSTPLATGTYYVSQNPLGFESVRATVTVNVTPSIIDNTIGSDQNICTGSIPAPFTGSLPTGGSGTYAYLWETSTTSPGTTGYTSASFTTQEMTSTTALTTNRWYRRRVISGVCTTYSAPIKMTIGALIAGNTVTPSTQTICSGNAAALITSASPTGGLGGVYTYSWESSTTSSTTGFTVIPGANLISYSPGTISQTTWYRRTVTSGPCPATVSAVVVVNVNNPILNNDASGTQAVCSTVTPIALTGTSPSGGNGSTYAYLWEVSSSASGPFSSASVTTQSYSVTNPGSSRWYRRRVTSGVCPVSYSDTIALTIGTPIAGNTITAAQSICFGTSATALTSSSPTGGLGGVYTYLWESSTTSSTAGFDTISGETSISFSPGVLAQTTWYKRTVTSGPCPATTSAVIAVTVGYPILNNDASGSQTTCSNVVPSSATGSLPTGGIGTYAYQWEQSTSINGPYTNSSFGGTQNYNFPTTYSANTWFRRKVTSGACAATYSDTLAITVVTAIGNNFISGTQTICTGNSPTTFTGTLPTNGNGVYDYTWESSTTSSTTGFSPIPSSNSQNYSSGPLSVPTWFRRRINSSACQLTSTVIAISINQPILTNSITADQTICANSAPDTLRGPLPTGGTGTYTYSWEIATAAAGPFTAISSTNRRDYKPPVLTTSRWYRRRVTSGACPVLYSGNVAITVIPTIATNTVSSSQAICTGSSPSTFVGSNPTGGAGAGSYTYQWEGSTTSASAGFSPISGEVNKDYSGPGPLTADVWYRRVVSSSVCSNTSTAVQVSVSQLPTVSVGPAVPSVVQGGITIALGGGFGGSATGAVWSAPEGTFSNNSGSTPGTATYQSSLISAPTITLTISTVGGACPPATATKDVTVIPDPFGITGVVNDYGQIVGPVSLPIGSLRCTLAAGQGARFAKNDRALLIQMKGASVSLPTNPTDITYGYITAMGNSGNHEYLNIDSVDGDVVFFQRCIRKAYTISGSVQLVKIPTYTGNYNIKGSSYVTGIRVTRKGMGYAPNSIISSGFTVTPVSGGVGLTLQAYTDALGQISEVEVLNGGVGYLQPPLITFPDPTEAPFNLPAYRAKALAITGLTAKQWNGKTGGILALEVNGNVTLFDSIHMTGMGFSGGMIGDKGDVAPTCGASAEYALDFSNYTRAGQKGEGITTIPVNRMRGKGRYATGGGGGVEPEGGGGGGANWQDGGRGGSSSYVVIPLSACSTSITTCDKDALRGGLGGGTNPTTPVGFKNVLRANSYYYTPDFCRIFLGGGGGGGHAFDLTPGSQPDGGGGFGGGIVILKADQLTSNNLEILAKGERGESTANDGAGGGGAGGAVILMVDSYVDPVKARVNGGNGGNAMPYTCEYGYGFFPDRKRYFGAGGGGGGGVVWFTQPDVDVTALAASCNLAQSAIGTNQDILNNTAQKGGSARSQSEFTPIENIPYTGSTFTVGGTSPAPNFKDLAKAAEFLAAKGTDAAEITLLVTNNISNPSHISWYEAPAVFKKILTPGCTYGDATITIKPRTTAQSVNLRNSADDINFITLDGIPSVRFENLTISGDDPSVNTNILVKGGSKLEMENVILTADIKSDPSLDNQIQLKNTTHTGGITAGANQTVNLDGNITLNGLSTVAPSITLGANSVLNLSSGSNLNLNGVSWINNGAAQINIDATNNLNLGGTFTNQVIGGTASTNFDKLNITGSGTITATNHFSVNDWNQTGSATISTSNKTITITGKVGTGTGKFTSTGAGRVSLTAIGDPVEVSGEFDNLEVNDPGKVSAVKPIIINRNLILSQGRLDMGPHSLTIENNSGSAVVNTPESWVYGAMKRKVIPGNSYSFPIGSASSIEKSIFNINSTTGLQYLTCSFVDSDPNSHPVASIVDVTPDGPAIFSTLAPEGYWNITPDAGSADYDVALFPSFVGAFTQNTVYKRPTHSNQWSLFGTLDNQESSPSYIQSDGSVRRVGLSGFSDFGLGGGEVPLALHFLDFKAVLRRGQTRLNWKMAECQKEGRFTILRGTSTRSFEKVGSVTVDNTGCVSDFEAIDNLPTADNKFYYQIEASAPGEKTIHSPVRMVSLTESGTEKPFLAVVQNDHRKFQIMSDDIEETGINIVSMEGKVIAKNLKAEDKILDLRSIPQGVYLVEMVNSGWSVRQRIVVGL